MQRSSKALPNPDRLSARISRMIDRSDGYDGAHEVMCTRIRAAAAAVGEHAVAIINRTAMTNTASIDQFFDADTDGVVDLLAVTEGPESEIDLMLVVYRALHEAQDCHPAKPTTAGSHKLQKVREAQRGYPMEPAVIAEADAMEASGIKPRRVRP